MNECNKILFPILDAIGEHAVEKKRYAEGSPEWQKQEEELQELHKRAISVFEIYHPAHRKKHH